MLLLLFFRLFIIKLCSMEKFTAKYISRRQKNEYINMDQIRIVDEDEESNDNGEI